ncbi:ceramide-1-phosphate transfer protein [Amia ocellicauda]|uniref:ceramide-1-phosphate transfer protein n=1 Tax=Amia ocellicauda TaxID=2972642 RepID=UPI003464657B
MACWLSFRLAFSWRGRYLLPLALAALLLFLGSAWLQSALESCAGHWPCLSAYRQDSIDGQRDRHRPETHEKDSEPLLAPTPAPETDHTLWGSEVGLRACPGQRFQMGRTLWAFETAVTDDQDILLDRYLAGWEELVKFLEALGSVLGFISQEVTGKIGQIRGLAEREGVIGMDTHRDTHRQTHTDPAQAALSTLPPGPIPLPEPYRTLRSMVRGELDRGLVDFSRQTVSGCRTVLRLHRALLWLTTFLRRLGSDRHRHPSELCRDSYRLALAPYHGWLVRQAAELAFLAVPDRPTFLRLICVEGREGAGGVGGDSEAAVLQVLDRAVRSMHTVYNITQHTLQLHNMLQLP